MSVPFAIDLTLRRYDAQTRNAAGRTQAATSTTSTIRGTWQPANGEDVRRLFGGEYTGAVFEVITDTQLRATSVDGALPADVLERSGEAWQVRHVEDWTAAPMLGHWHAFVTRRAVSS